MAGRYVAGETKVRPGIYFREVNGGGAELASARNGIVAVAFKADWGPLNEVVKLSSPAEISQYFGEAGANSNVDILNDVFIGGASEIRAVRLGTGGTKAAITLKDTATTPANVLTLTSKYPGARALSITVKDSLSISTQRECIIYSGTTELYKVNFAKEDGNEAKALADAINADEYAIVTATFVAQGNGILAALTQEAFTTAGASPTITSADYSTAFTALEATTFNTLCVDTDDVAVHALVKAFIQRANDGALMAVAVVGEPTSVSFANRKAHAAAFNSCNMIYVANGFVLGGATYEGYKAAAVIAGLVAYIPSNDSVTHKSVPSATNIVGPLTNTQIIEALQSGCIIFTASAAGAVWIEQGINTLVTLTAQQDAGWKKIRRTKTRFELIQRILESSENIIGSVNNDSNGRATFIAIANGIIKAMIAEGKLLSGTVTEDPSNPAKGDSAWFIIDVLDLDSIEHVYLTYQFRFGDD